MVGGTTESDCSNVASSRSSAKLEKPKSKTLLRTRKSSEIVPVAGSHVAPALWQVVAGQRSRVCILSLDTSPCRHTRNGAVEGVGNLVSLPPTAQGRLQAVSMANLLAMIVSVG